MNKIHKVHANHLKEFIEDAKLFVAGKYKEITLSSPHSKAGMSCVMLTHHKTPVVYITMTDYSGNVTDRYVDTREGDVRVAEFISYTGGRVCCENAKMTAVMGDNTQHEFSWEFIAADEEQPK
jgi:hypothetical protein